jgi:hypothetical protein
MKLEQLKKYWNSINYHNLVTTVWFSTQHTRGKSLAVKCSFPAGTISRITIACKLAQNLKMNGPLSTETTQWRAGEKEWRVDDKKDKPSGQYCTLPHLLGRNECSEAIVRAPGRVGEKGTFRRSLSLLDQPNYCALPHSGASSVRASLYRLWGVIQSAASSI